MTIEIKEIPTPTKEQQDVCEHDFGKMGFLMSGEVAEVCRKCFFRKDIRPMTDKEADRFYDNF